METNRDAVMIAAAKLIANDVVPKVDCYFVCDVMTNATFSRQKYFCFL